MSKRKIEVINKDTKIDLFQLKIGEVLILDGNRKISWDPMEKVNKAVEIQVSIGYTGYEKWKFYNEIG